MSFLRRFLRHPQQLWLRRLNLQIHLITGIVLALYLVVMGITGAVLVFGTEIIRVVDPNPFKGINLPKETADLSQVITSISARYPHIHVVSITAPTADEPVFIAVIQSGKRRTLQCDAQTGQILSELHRHRSRIGWVYDLHEDLFARRPGRVANGIGAAFLFLLSITGLINWWPGIRQWPRALRIDFRRRWRRLNFDLHSAIGFWSFGFLVIWSISGIYFAWPEDSLNFINRFSSIINSRPPGIAVDYQTDISTLNFHQMLLDAQTHNPGTRFKGIIFPASRRSPFEILLARSPGIGRDNEDTVYFNPYTGEYISTWQYGVNRSIGDWLIWLQIPLHFGTHWGLAVKCIWALFGLSLPVLSVTGILMYWNRSLSKRWQALKNQSRLAREHTSGLPR